jgi:N-acetylmuramoyl-L-alanine amidase
MMFVEVMLAAALQVGALPVQRVVRDAGRPRVPAKVAVNKRRAKKPVRRAVPLVVIDAGHGGPDGGGPILINGKLREKDITLQVAMKVGEYLRAKGVEVRYTRTSDTLIALADRGKIANQASADVFVSIHVNAANPHWKDPESARGFETYYLAEAKTEDARRVEDMENESVRFESETDVKANDPLSFILRDMEQNQYLRESADFAEIVQRRLGRIHPGPNRGVKQAGFRVLLTAFMPAVLVEIGFGTNPSEANYLASQAKQRDIARAVSDATFEYLGGYQRRLGGSAGSSPGSHE